MKAAIAAEAAKLPLMEQEWPRAWVEVEEALLAADKTHINGEEFAAICARCGVDDAFEQQVLGGYLHDLGKILYYQDDDVLCDFVVLKPNWLTGAMARVLDDAVTRDQRHGVLDHADFPRIWHGYDRRLYPVFTRMLERFLISYQLEEPAPGRRQSMVPLLLPHSPPAELPPWAEVLPDQPEVRMVFDLDFVPDGIMSWFIVLTHHYSQDLHWREGVRLQYDGHQAACRAQPQHPAVVAARARAGALQLLQHPAAHDQRPHHPPLLRGSDLPPPCALHLPQGPRRGHALHPLLRLRQARGAQAARQADHRVRRKPTTMSR